MRSHRWRWLLVGVLAVTAGLVPVEGLTRLATAEVVPATVTVSGTSPSGSFSPNGDNQDDTVTVPFCLSAPANVTAVAIDSNDSIVRTVVNAMSFPAGCNNGGVRWDGRTDVGALAPDGAYGVRLTALNASGTSTEATVQ